tara:strand:+ start:1302 stop:1568 length:267 start_codon:yes stop_codon:yes gene_type:complete
MKDMLPKGFSEFLKNPDMSKLVCVVIAVFLAVLILRYFKVIEGMSDFTSEMMRGGAGAGGGGRGSDGHSDKKENMLPDPSALMKKLGM